MPADRRSRSPRRTDRDFWWVRRESANPLLIRRAELKPPNVVLAILEVAKDKMGLTIATDAMVMLKKNGEEWANDARVNDVVGGETGADAISIAFKDIPAVSSQATYPKSIVFAFSDAGFLSPLTPTT